MITTKILIFNFSSFKDEISEFASTCILNPPGPRDIVNENARVANGTGNVRTNQATTNKKRKNSNTVVDGETVSVKTKKDKGIKLTFHFPIKNFQNRLFFCTYCVHLLI